MQKQEEVDGRMPKRVEGDTTTGSSSVKSQDSSQYSISHHSLAADTEEEENVIVPNSIRQLRPASRMADSATTAKSRENNSLSTGNSLDNSLGNHNYGNLNYSSNGLESSLDPITVVHDGDGHLATNDDNNDDDENMDLNDDDNPPRPPQFHMSVATLGTTMTTLSSRFGSSLDGSLLSDDQYNDQSQNLREAEEEEHGQVYDYRNDNSEDDKDDSDSTHSGRKDNHSPIKDNYRLYRFPKLSRNSNRTLPLEEDTEPPQPPRTLSMTSFSSNRYTSNSQESEKTLSFSQSNLNAVIYTNSHIHSESSDNNLNSNSNSTSESNSDSDSDSDFDPTVPPKLISNPKLEQLISSLQQQQQQQEEEEEEQLEEIQSPMDDDMINDDEEEEVVDLSSSSEDENINSDNENENENGDYITTLSTCSSHGIASLQGPRSVDGDVHTTDDENEYNGTAQPPRRRKMRGRRSAKPWGDPSYTANASARKSMDLDDIFGSQSDEFTENPSGGNNNDPHHQHFQQHTSQRTATSNNSSNATITAGNTKGSIHNRARINNTNKSHNMSSSSSGGDWGVFSAILTNTFGNSTQRFGPSNGIGKNTNDLEAQSVGSGLPQQQQEHSGRNQRSILKRTIPPPLTSGSSTPPIDIGNDSSVPAPSEKPIKKTSSKILQRMKEGWGDGTEDDDYLHITNYHSAATRGQRRRQQQQQQQQHRWFGIGGSRESGTSSARGSGSSSAVPNDTILTKEQEATYRLALFWIAGIIVFLVMVVVLVVVVFLLKESTDS